MTTVKRCLFVAQIAAILLFAGTILLFAGSGLYFVGREAGLANGDSAPLTDHPVEEAPDHRQFPALSHWGDFKAKDYINEAVRLQTLGREAAVRELHTRAKVLSESTKVIVLCRMLFVA